MSEDSEEKEQLERFRRGEPGAFDDLYGTYGPRLYQFGLRLCGKPADAEDLKQDVFIAAYRNLHRFEGRSSLTTYLYRIAVYCWGQRRSALRPVMIGWDENWSNAREATQADPAHHSHTRMELRAALATLSDAQRAAFLLVKADGFTSEEAARMLNIPVGTVKYQVHEALQRLRAILGGGVEASSETRPKTRQRKKPIVVPNQNKTVTTVAEATSQSKNTKEAVRKTMDDSEKLVFVEPEEVEGVLGVPVLGLSPMISEEGLRLIRDSSNFSPLMECYRAIRTNLRFRTDTPLRTLVVASSVPAEGKSTTAANLAMALAKAKKRVILVDADLRRPSQQKLFRVNSNPGLTDVLSGTHSIEQVLRPTSVDGVFLIPAGSPSQLPTELLESEEMEQLLDSLKEQSDMVIIDTPPVLAVADTCAFAHATDGVLVVIGMGETRRSSVQWTIDRLGRCRATVLGTMLNRMPVAGGYYYGKYYVPRVGLNA